MIHLGYTPKRENTISACITNTKKGLVKSRWSNGNWRRSRLEDSGREGVV